MSRGLTAHPLRCAAVWIAVTMTTAVSGLSAAAVWRNGVATSTLLRFDDLLVAACSAALLAAMSWLWVITTVTVADLARGRAPRTRSGQAQRIVLVLCGIAVSTAVATPASAQAPGSPAVVPPTGAHLLTGLPVPDRVTAPVADHSDPPPAHPRAADVHVVSAGESLWSIASQRAGNRQSVESAWRELWQHNHELVGPDPDLIRPGQRLRIPSTDTFRHDQHRSTP